MNLRRIAVYTLFVCCATFCAAQVTLAPVPQLQFLDQNAKPLAFGCVFTYASGTSTPLATFTDYTGTVQNANPVTLNASGSANIWLQSGQPYTFTVKSNGGTDCSLGTLMYSVDGIGAGGTQLTTVVAQTSGSVTFIDQSQNQLYQITLTGDMVGLPISAVGVTPPGFITFQITQDGVGNHIFTWPSNTRGGCTISSTASNTTLQTFVWDGTTATAVAPCTVGNGPTSSVGDLIDQGLSASGGVCTDANKKLTSSCSAINSVTYNGQTVANGGSGNVNAGAANHSIALNKGAGNAFTGLLLAANQFPLGASSADPTASTLPSCTDTAGQHLNYTLGGSITCGTSSTSASLAGISGYVWIGPILVQWKTSAHDWASNERSAQNETWPIPFPTNCFNVQATAKFDSPVSTNFQGVNFDVNSCSTTTVNIYGEIRSDGTADSSFHAFIVGIGN